MKVLKAFEKGIDVFCRVMEVIGGILMAALTLDVFLNVIFRAINRPIIVSVELTTIFFPWIVCVSMIVIARRNENTALVLFFDKFKGLVKHIAVFFINGIMLAFSVIMAKSAFELSASLANEYLSLTHLSKAFTYGSMVIGFIGVSFMLIFNVVEYVLLDILKIDEKGRAD